MSELPEAHQVQVKRDHPRPDSIEEADAALDADLDRIENRLRIDRPELFDESGAFREDLARRLLTENQALRQANTDEVVAALTRHQGSRPADAP